MAELDLERYSETPIYNTKAVSQRTGVTAATLRAWERRYGVPEPKRSESNYRLYSERDIALIRWLQTKMEEGISIRQAVELYHHVRSNPPEPPPAPTRVRDQESSIAALIAAFKRFDETRAERLVNELFALYPVESVLMEILAPAMIEVGDQWHRGEISVPVEHFASAYVQRKLMALMNADPVDPAAPLIISGCAPREQHELGILLHSVFLRRAGLRVIYLGANVPVGDLRITLDSLHPQVLAFSASTPEVARGLAALTAMIREARSPRPLLCVGGAAFDFEPGLVAELDATALPSDPREAVGVLEGLLAGIG